LHDPGIFQRMTVSAVSPREQHFYRAGYRRPSRHDPVFDVVRYLVIIRVSIWSGRWQTYARLIDELVQGSKPEGQLS